MATRRPAGVIKVSGDGNCMYRAVACHLNPDIASLARTECGLIIAEAARPIEDAAAMSLRSRVASYMERHWDEFPTVLPQTRSERVAGIRGQEWGGEEELAALAKVLNQTVAVHDISRGRYTSYPPSREGDGTIHLRYTRDERAVLITGDVEACGHYDLLLYRS